MSRNVRSYDPPEPLCELAFPPGEWLILTEENLVRLSGPSPEEVVAEAGRLKIDLADSLMRQTPLTDDCQLVFDP